MKWIKKFEKFKINKELIKKKPVKKTEKKRTISIDGWSTY